MHSLLFCWKTELLKLIIMGAEQSRIGGRRGRPTQDNGREKNVDMVAANDFSDTESMSGSVTGLSDHQAIGINNDDNNSVDSNGNRSSQYEDNTSLMSRSTLVVVHEGEEQQNVTDIRTDPLFQRINEIPMFLPILENFNKRFPWSKPDPREFSSKIDRGALVRMGQHYNGYIRKQSGIVTRNQMRLIKKIKQVDAALGKMLKSFTVRQKRCAYHAKKLEQVPDLNRNLAKCQKTLSEALNTVQLLNDLLPEGEKLEPFLWGDDDSSSNAFNPDVKEETPVSVDIWQ